MVRFVTVFSLFCEEIYTAKIFLFARGTMQGEMEEY